MWGFEEGGTDCPGDTWAALGKGLECPAIFSVVPLSAHPVPSCSFLPVSLGFFDDILIPPESLQQPAKLYPLKVNGAADIPAPVVMGAL